MKYLIVIDMQNDFIMGSLASPEARSIVPKVVEKIENLSSKGYSIIYTRDNHNSNYLQTQEGRKLPVEHCIMNSKGWKYCSEIENVLEKNPTQRICDKDSFGSLSLPFFISGEMVEEIQLIGLCTDICVISNALILKAAFPETPITVDASCCAGVTPKSHKNALESMKMCQIEVINEEDMKDD